MFFLTFIAELIVIYIVSFKEDFTKEELDKATPFIVLIVAAFLILGILLSLVGGSR